MAKASTGSAQVVGSKSSAARISARVDVDEAEYWEANDSKIVRSLKYLLAAATKGAVDVGTHGTVSVNR